MMSPIFPDFRSRFREARRDRSSECGRIISYVANGLAGATGAGTPRQTGILAAQTARIAAPARPKGAAGGETAVRDAPFRPAIACPYGRLRACDVSRTAACR
jgi:hypothetical protein